MHDIFAKKPLVCMTLLITQANRFFESISQETSNQIQDEILSSIMRCSKMLKYRSLFLGCCVVAFCSVHKMGLLVSLNRKHPYEQMVCSIVFKF